VLVGDNRPAGEQQAGCEVSGADRHPHEQPRELLVVERGQSLRPHASEIPSVERIRGQGDEAAEQAAMHQRGEGGAERRPDLPARSCVGLQLSALTQRSWKSARRQPPQASPQRQYAALGL
jgi:hypothetical protein